MASSFLSVQEQRSVEEGSSRTLPIACRFVPFDQWLITHIDTSWKIKEIKHWILSKCDALGESQGCNPPRPPRFRPSSPVRFAPSRRSSFDSASSRYSETGDGDTDDGDNEDWDIFAYDAGNSYHDVHSDNWAASPKPTTTVQDKYPSGSQTSLRQDALKSFGSMSLINASNLNQDRATTPLAVTRYVLFSFSCGYILEDEASLSWYKLRPFELLELHRAGSIVTLTRRSALAYADPYFECLVRVSERGGRKSKARRGAGGAAMAVNLRGPMGDDQHMAHALEWKTRWAIVRDGILYLCKESSSAPTHRFPLSALSAIKRAEETDLSSRAYPRVLSLKFKLPRDLHQRNASHFDMIESDWSFSNKSMHEKVKTSTWVILDLPGANSFEGLLRTLHRLAPTQVHSSFVPSIGSKAMKPASPTISSPSSPIEPPTSLWETYHNPSTINRLYNKSQRGFTVRFPEWRHALFDRARQSGLGEVGHAMTQYLCGSDKDVSLVESCLRKQASIVLSASNFLSDTQPPVPDNIDDDDNDEDDIESLLEWEGWTRDVARHVIEQRPQFPLPSNKRSYSDQFIDENWEALPSSSSPTNTTGSPGEACSSGAYSTSSSSSDHSGMSVSDSRHGSREVNEPQTSVVRSRALSFLQPARVSKSDSSSSLNSGLTNKPALRSRSRTVTSVKTIVPDLVMVHRDEQCQTMQDGDVGASSINNQRQASTSLRLSLAVQPDSNMLATETLIDDDHNLPTSITRTHGIEHGIGNMKRIVRGVSIKNAITAGTDRIARELEDALDFVDGR